MHPHETPAPPVAEDVIEEAAADPGLEIDVTAGAGNRLAKFREFIGNRGIVPAKRTICRALRGCEANGWPWSARRGIERDHLDRADVDNPVETQLAKLGLEVDDELRGAFVSGPCPGFSRPPPGPGGETPRPRPIRSPALSSSSIERAAAGPGTVVTNRAAPDETGQGETGRGGMRHSGAGGITAFGSVDEASRFRVDNNNDPFSRMSELPAVVVTLLIVIANNSPAENHADGGRKERGRRSAASHALQRGCDP